MELKTFLHIIQLAISLFVFGLYYLMFIWQAPDFMQIPDWREHTIFTKSGAETASFLDQGVYVAKHHTETIVMLFISLAWFVIVLYLMYKKYKEANLCKEGR